MQAKKAARVRAVLRDERGAVTAEFAVALTVVVAVLGVLVGALILAGQQIALSAAAVESSRLAARGDSAAAASRLTRLPYATTVRDVVDGDFLCRTVSANPGAGPLAAITLSATGCAAVSSDEP